MLQEFSQKFRQNYFTVSRKIICIPIRSFLSISSINILFKLLNNLYSFFQHFSRLPSNFPLFTYLKTYTDISPTFSKIILYSPLFLIICFEIYPEVSRNFYQNISEICATRFPNLSLRLGFLINFSSVPLKLFRIRIIRIRLASIFKYPHFRRYLLKITLKFLFN